MSTLLLSLHVHTLFKTPHVGRASLRARLMPRCRPQRKSNAVVPMAMVVTLRNAFCCSTLQHALRRLAPEQAPEHTGHPVKAGLRWCWCGCWCGCAPSRPACARLVASFGPVRPHRCGHRCECGCCRSHVPHGCPATAWAWLAQRSKLCHCAGVGSVGIVRRQQGGCACSSSLPHNLTLLLGSARYF